MPGSPRILLAEDEPRVGKVIRDALVLSGYSVDHVHDGREALRQYHESSYSLLILDFVMPGLTGLDVLSGLRTRGDRIPVILMSGNPRGIERLDSAAYLYHVEVLRKPFALAELRRAVERASPEL